MSRHPSFVFLIAFVISASAFAPAAGAATVLPLERQVREQFPSLVLDSHTRLEPVQELVAGRLASGMRARGALRVFYPSSYDEAFVVELGEQRVVLRAVGAHFAQAATSTGKLFYTRPHDGVDVIEVPSAGRSEELLVLHDERAPRVFEYEIVEMRGVAGLMMQDGAIRFFPDHVAVPTVTERAGGRFTALQASLQIDRPWVIDTKGRRSESAAHWTIVGGQGQPQTIRLTIDSDALAYPLVVDPSFSATGSMTTARNAHTATVLPSGKVLIAGGFSDSDDLSSAELYDAASGTFTATNGPLITARVYHTATLLPNGKVLIAGGQNGSDVLNTAELYDAVTDTFTATSLPMTSARQYHTATLLQNGKVLIAGGQNNSGALNTAELYDAASGTFTATNGPLITARVYHTATLLPNGKVLIAGGMSGSDYTNMAEMYDPTNGTFTATTTAMISARGYHTATLLPDGKVLIAGGFDGSAILNKAELYDPAAGANGTFTATNGPMITTRAQHSATLLPNGKVLIAAGSETGVAANTAELYDPASGTFTATTTAMISARRYHTATLLPNGKVMAAGGRDALSVSVNTAELYDETLGTFAATSGLMTLFRESHTATLLANGRVLIAGSGTNTAELYDPASGTFTATSAPMTSPRYGPEATLLANGKVLITGGIGGTGAVNTAELYDPASGTFTATSAPMTSPRHGHKATLLANGEVLISGGDSGTGSVNTAELDGPASGTFTATSAPMTTVRAEHTATLLPSGKVLITGGIGASSPLNMAELYDVASGTFTATSAPMTTVRDSHTATLLPNGKVLIAGGHIPSTSSELYDPAGGTFTVLSAGLTIRYFHTATLLPNGKVLIAGGQSGFSYVSTAELYDPAGVLGAAATSAPMTSARKYHTATLLPNGKVLIAGGFNGATLNTAELYDTGVGYSDARRPVLSSITTQLCQPANLALSGSRFMSDSEGSGGSTNSSAANAPLLRLQRVDNEQLQFAPTQIFSASSFFSATLSNLSSGRYRAAIVSSAVPSIEQIIDVGTTPLLGTYSTASLNLSDSTTLAASSLPADYHGSFYPQTATASSGFTGTLRIADASGAVTVTNAGPLGDFTVTIASSTGCGSAMTTFTLKVIGPPSSVTATGGTPQSAQLNTAFATALQVTVTDSVGHPLNNVAVNFTVPATGASAVFPSGAFAFTNASGIAAIIPTANGTLGSYDVTAIVGEYNATFALTNTAALPPTNVAAIAASATSVTITWNGTVASTYEVLRVAAGNVLSTIGSSDSGSLTDMTASPNTAYLYKVRRILPSVSDYSSPDLATTVIFADARLTSNETAVKTAHITDLRTAVDAVRALAGLGAGAYTDPTIGAGITPIKASHVGGLRKPLDDAVKTLNLPEVIYTTPVPLAGTTTISAAHINDLRQGVK